MDKLKKLKHKLDNIDSDLNQIVDTYLFEEYYYAFQIVGIYPYLRNGWWIIALIQYLVMGIILVFNCYIILLPIPELFNVSIVIFSQNVHIALLGLYLVSNIVYHQLKRRKVAKFVEAVATSFFDYNEPFQGDVAKLKKEMMRERKIWLLLPLSVLVCGGTVLLLAPTIDTYGGFDFDKISSLVNLKMLYRFTGWPFSYENDIMYYLVYIVQLLGAGFLVICLAVGLTAYLVMTQPLILEMKILKDSIRNIEIRTLIMVSSVHNIELNLPDHLLYEHPVFITCYEKCLKKNFQHHQIILRYFNYWSSMFSFVAFSSCAIGSITVALSLLSTGSWNELPGTAITSITLCCLEVFLFYYLFHFSQQITDLNEELRDEMYNIKWYYCHASIRKSITIFQVMTLRPMVLRGCGMVPASMYSFANVVNASYSYYNMVNAFK